MSKRGSTAGESELLSILKKSFKQGLMLWPKTGVAKLFGSRAKFQEKIVLRAAKKLMKQNLCLFSPKRG